MSDLRELVINIFQKEGWVTAEEPAGCFFEDRPMITDPETGMIINATRYPAGFYKPLHRHTCSHAIYVIDGKLKTDTGIYGPGSLVWHPAGYETGHGATENEPCTFLFIANKSFDIEFLPTKHDKDPE